MITFRSAVQNARDLTYYSLDESSSGYCIRFKIYVGQDKKQGTDTPASESIDMEKSKIELVDTGKWKQKILKILSNHHVFYRTKPEWVDLISCYEKMSKRTQEKDYLGIAILFPMRTFYLRKLVALIEQGLCNIV